MTRKQGNYSKKRVDAISKINSANDCADSMLTRINECFQDSIKGLPKIKSAVVSAVNDDGTVNVYFPPNDKKLFTRISNQGAFTLQAGDGVELMLKNGTFDNCWVIAKHGVNRADMNTIQNNKTSGFEKSKNQVNIDSSSVVGVTKTSQLINDSGFITKNSPTINNPTIYSANLTGNPTAPTQTITDDSTKIATTAFVKNAINAIEKVVVDSAMSTTSPNPLQNNVITQEINDLKAQIAEIKLILEGLTTETT